MEIYDRGAEVRVTDVKDSTGKIGGTPGGTGLNDAQLHRLQSQKCYLKLFYFLNLIRD